MTRARHLDTSTASRQLDKARQASRQLDAPAHGVSLDKARQARQGSTDKASTTASTEPRQLDSSTARAQDENHLSNAIDLTSPQREKSPMTYMPVTRTLSLLGCSQREIRYILENLITVVNTPLGHRLKGHLCSTIGTCVRSALPLPGGLLRSIARRATACAKVAIRRARETIDPKLRRHLRS